jgi:hypothetical protein
VVEIMSADSWYQLFLTVLRASYEGTATFRDRVYTFEPRLLEAYDILRKRDPPQDKFDEFLAALDQRFFDVGWLSLVPSSRRCRCCYLLIGEYLYANSRYGLEHHSRASGGSWVPPTVQVGSRTLPPLEAPYPGGCGGLGYPARRMGRVP